MEDRKTAIAVFLCIVVVMVYMQIVFPKPAPQLSQQGVAPTAAASNQASLGTDFSGVPPVQSPVAVSQPPRQTRVSEADLQASPLTRLESALFQIEIKHLGARLSSFKLKGYRKFLKQPEFLDMVSSGFGAPLPLGLYFENQNDEAVMYQLMKVEGLAEPSDGGYLLSEGNRVSLVFEGRLPSGLTIQKTFRFNGGSYLFDVAASVPSTESGPVWLEWTRVESPSDSRRSYDPESFVLLDLNKKLQSSLVSGIKTDGLTVLEEGGRWLSYMDSYFMAALIPPLAAPRNAGKGRFMLVDAQSGAEAKELYVSRVSGAPAAGNFSVYLGPKDYRALEGLEFDLHRGIDLGFFSFLAYPLLLALRLFESWLGNYGLAIILLTLVIKAILLPLTKAQIESGRKMADIQPEVKALRERIKDSTQLNQEMLALYKRRGVNPMGGCLPILVQIPVFFGLFSALRNSIELRHAGFALWITDLSAPEKLYIFGLGIPVMVLLMGLSMYLQQRSMPAALDPAQQKAMNMMPIIFTVMFVIFPMPAGLTLYWLVSNIISIIQQEYIRNDKKASPLSATIVASVGIFILGYVLTLF